MRISVSFPTVDHQLTHWEPSPAFGLGLATRFALHSHPQSHGIYILEDLLVVLSVRRSEMIYLPLFPDICPRTTAVSLHRRGLRSAWSPGGVPSGR